MKKLFLLVEYFTLLVLIGCGIPREEHNAALSEIKALNDEIKFLNYEVEQYKYGEERLLALIRKAYSENDIETARENIELFRKHNPESINLDDFIRLAASVEGKEEENRIEAVKMDREKAAYEETTLFDLELWGRKGGTAQESKKFKAKVLFSHQDGVRMVFCDIDRMTNGLFFVEKRFPEMTDGQLMTIYFLARRQEGLLLNSILHIIEP
jgi:hypothetical protein